MIRSLAKRVSPSLVISCTALFIALGSVGYSATGGTFKLGKANTAGKTTALKSGNVSGPTLKVNNTGNRPAAAFLSNSGQPPFTVNRTTKVANLNADQLDGLDSLAFLLTSTVFGGDVAGPFGDLQLGNGVVGTNQLADGSVTSAKVLDETITAFDIATNGVNSAEIATDAVGATEIQNDSIDAGEIVDFGLTNQDIGVLFAEVQANGTLDNSSGANNGNAVTVAKLAGTGTYEVDFGRNIQACTAVATIGPSGGGSALGEVNVADRGGNAEAVFVDTNNSDGTAADKPFRLVVVC
jgi:hypothetical protein